jgi:phosphoglycolate phosphatase-like HAD superfamily hydrolase
MSLRAVFYDLDGTLRLNVPNSWRAFAEFARELGLASTPADLHRVARWEHAYFAQSPEVLADTAAFPEPADFWLNFCQRELLALGADARQAVELAPQLSRRMDEDYKPDDRLPEGLLETLASLKADGYLLGVLSNRDKPYRLPRQTRPGRIL